MMDVTFCFYAPVIEPPTPPTLLPCSGQCQYRVVAHLFWNPSSNVGIQSPVFTANSMNILPGFEYIYY